MSSPESRLAVVGAGIGGLTLTIALKRLGEIGAAITLSANGTRQLRRPDLGAPGGRVVQGTVRRAVLRPAPAGFAADGGPSEKAPVDTVNVSDVVDNAAIIAGSTVQEGA